MALVDLVQAWRKEFELEHQARIRERWPSAPLVQDLRIEFDPVIDSYFLVSDLVERETGLIVGSAPLFRINDIGDVFPINARTGAEQKRFLNLYEWGKEKHGRRADDPSDRDPGRDLGADPGNGASRDRVHTESGDSACSKDERAQAPGGGEEA